MALTQVPIELSSTPGIVDNSNATAITIDSSENVGMGASSPAAKLHVSGSFGSQFRLQETGGTYFDIAAGGRFDLKNAAGTTIVSIAQSGSPVGTQLNLDSSGRVGIGTSSPTDTLNISSNTNQIGLDTGDQATYGTLDVGHFTNGAFIGTQAGSNAASNLLRFGTSGTERMRIDASGNVGIGVTPESWNTYKTLQIGNGAIANYTPTHDMRIVSNAYYNSGWKYAESDGACLYLQDGDNSTHIWSVAASGTADAALTWSDAMRIDSSGRLLVGLTGASGFGTVETDTFTTTGQCILARTGGNVGIGTSSPAARLHVPSSSDDTRTSILASGVTGDPNFQLAAWSGTGGSPAGSEVVRVGLGYGATKNSYIHFHRGGATTGGFMSFSTNNGTEAMRIDASGNVGIGVTSVDAKLKVQAASGNTTFNCFNAGSGSQTYIAFNLSGGGTATGSITTNGSTTAYNQSSDARLKENIADADDAGSKVDAIQVRKYDWKADGSHQDYGMIAQELQAVAPEAVTGDADSDEMMGVDYSKLVPMLVKEIQSLRARVQQLENN